MRVRFHNHAVKFLEKLDEKDRERIRLKLKSLVGTIEDQGIIPFKELDVKRLEGEWRGFLRMRLGKTRIIFRMTEKMMFFWYTKSITGEMFTSRKKFHHPSFLPISPLQGLLSSPKSRSLA